MTQGASTTRAALRWLVTDHDGAGALWVGLGAVKVVAAVIFEPGQGWSLVSVSAEEADPHVESGERARSVLIGPVTNAQAFVDGLIQLDWLDALRMQEPQTGALKPSPPPDDVSNVARQDTASLPEADWEDLDVLRTRQTGHKEPDNGARALVWRFYKAFFGLHPELRVLFPHPFNTVLPWVTPLFADLHANTHHPDVFGAALERLVRFHERYMTEPEHFGLWGEVMAEVLRRNLKDVWTPDLKRRCAQVVQEVIERLEFEQFEQSQGPWSVDPSSPMLARPEGLLAAAAATRPRAPTLDPVPHDAPLDEPDTAPFLRPVRRVPTRKQTVQAEHTPSPLKAPPKTPNPEPLQNVRVEIDLDRSQYGDLIERGLVALLYDLATIKWTGTLELHNNDQRIFVEVLDGIFGTTRLEVDLARKALLHVFSWQSGSYRLDLESFPRPERFGGFGEPLRLLYEGIARHAAVNHIAQSLTADFRAYPVRTQWTATHLRALGSPEVLQRIAALCTGRVTLEKVLQNTFSDIRGALAAVCFALGTHMLVTRPQPCLSVEVVYTNLRGPGQGTPRADERRKSSKRRAERHQKLARGARRVNNDQEVRRNARRKALTPQQAYTMMNLDPGCGVDAVNQRFMELAATTLPGTRSGEGLDIERLSWCYQMLLEWEKVNTPSTSPAQTPSKPRRKRHRDVAKAIGTTPIAETKPAPQPTPSRSNIRKARLIKHTKVSHPIDKTPIVTPAPSAKPKPSSTPPSKKPAKKTPSRSPAPQAAALKPPPLKKRPLKRPPGWRRSPLDKLKEPTGDDHAEHFKYAQRMAETKKLDKSFKAVTRALELAPDNVEYQSFMSWLKYQRELLRMAQIQKDLHQKLKAIIGTDPASGKARAQIYLSLARISRAEEVEDEALKYFELAAKNDPDCVEAKREVRLHNMRNNEENNQSWIERLFSKKR